MVGQWRSVFGSAFSVLFFMFMYSASCGAAQLVVTEQKEAVFFIVSGQKGDDIQLEKTDLSLIYGLELDIRQGGTLYSLAGQDFEFQFPAAVTVFEGVLVGRSILKRQLAALFLLKHPGRYDMVATLCLSDGTCLEKIHSQLVFSDEDIQV
jgi:hypothetical protein